MSACAVLHVTSIPGGGVDRHVRDIRARGARDHLVWHAGEAADAIEQAHEPRFLPLDRDALATAGESLASWLRGNGVGIVHLHSLGRPARARAAWAAAALGVPSLVTLHDVLFLRPDAFSRGDLEADRAWLDEVGPALRGATRVIAPSTFIADLAARHVEGIAPVVVPNGSVPPAASPAAPHPAFAPGRFRRIVAAIGAIGPHKGARTLEALARRLAGTDTAVVVVGYLDSQAWPGWYDDHLFVHGPFEEPDAPALLRAYGAEVALFANTVPESFSYALSDAWAAGLPVIVPPEGALAERVRAGGGGWLLPPGFGVEEIAALLARLDTTAGRAEHAQVKSSLEHHDARRLPLLDAMNDALEDLYRRFGVPPAGPLDVAAAPAQRLLASQLDAGLFRHELVQLTRDLGELHEARRAAREFERNSQAWIAKLEQDVATLQGELREETARREALERAPLARVLRSRISAWLPEGVKRALGKGRDGRG